MKELSLHQDLLRNMTQDTDEQSGADNDLDEEQVARLVYASYRAHQALVGMSLNVYIASPIGLIKIA